MAKIPRRTYNKGLNDPDNHDSVVTHLEPDILERKVKWALVSITMNKASGGDRIPAELFQSWKIMLLKCCIQYVSKFGKLSSGHWTGKGQFSFQSQRRSMPKSVQTTGKLCSFHMLARLCWKSCKLSFSSTWTETFQMYKLGFKEAKEPEIKLPAVFGSQRNQGNSRKAYISASLTVLKPLCGSQQTVENSERDSNIRSPYLPPEKPVYRSRGNRGNWKWNNWLAQNWESSTTSLCMVTLLI